MEEKQSIKCILVFGALGSLLFPGMDWTIREVERFFQIATATRIAKDTPWIQYALMGAGGWAIWGWIAVHLVQSRKQLHTTVSVLDILGAFARHWVLSLIPPCFAPVRSDAAITFFIAALTLVCVAMVEQKREGWGWIGFISFATTLAEIIAIEIGIVVETQHLHALGFGMWHPFTYASGFAACLLLAKRCIKSKKEESKKKKLE